MNLDLKKAKSISQYGMIHLVMICLLVIFISSCSKSKNSPAPVINGPTGSLAVVYACSHTPPIDLYLNNNKAYTSPLIGEDYIPYFKVASGNDILGFYNTGTLNSLGSDTINIKTNQAYTFFISNLVADLQGTYFHVYTLVADTIVAPPSGQASIRLANMSPSAANSDLLLNGKVTITDIPFKQASSFVTIPASVQDTFKMVQTGTSYFVAATRPGIPIKAGGVYTIYIYGFADDINGEGITAAIMQNAQF